MGRLMDFLYRLHPRLAEHNDDVIMLHRLGEPREAWPQHLGTCRRCGNTYLLGTSCGDADHLHTKEQRNEQ